MTLKELERFYKADEIKQDIAAHHVQAESLARAQEGPATAYQTINGRVVQIDQDILNAALEQQRNRIQERITNLETQFSEL